MVEVDQAIRVVVNGEQQRLEIETSIADLLVSMQIQQVAIAVEVNGEIVVRESFDKTSLHDADVIEIVSLVGGG